MYSFGIYLYILCVRIAALFNTKARLLLHGHEEIFPMLRNAIKTNERYVWFHASSLGEFEQGRPLIERLRSRHPEYKILLTFFSPSGYEVRKNYENADIVCYIPFDTPRNARRFVRMVRPEKAFFIKYEFWKNMLDELRFSGAEVYSVSSIFRPGQVFFRKYAGPYARVLDNFDHFFVQNDSSRRLLAARGIKNVTVTGDTRFDRVIDICNAARHIPVVEKFAAGSKVLVAGSSWEPDEDIIIPYFNAHKELKLVLAPHVVSDAHIARIKQALGRPSVCITEADERNVAEADCLIVNTYGMLSSIYRYGQIAYVGGGFGVGIHNVPEAAVYGVPVIIGPNHHKFREANALVAEGGCMEISSPETFAMTMDLLLGNEERRAKAGAVAGRYIHDNAGASDAIFNAIKW